MVRVIRWDGKGKQCAVCCCVECSGSEIPGEDDDRDDKARRNEDGALPEIRRVRPMDMPKPTNQCHHEAADDCRAGVADGGVNGEQMRVQKTDRNQRNSRGRDRGKLNARHPFTIASDEQEARHACTKERAHEEIVSERIIPVLRRHD